LTNVGIFDIIMYITTNF